MILIQFAALGIAFAWLVIKGLLMLAIAAGIVAVIVRGAKRSRRGVPCWRRNY